VRRLRAMAEPPLRLISSVTVRDGETGRDTGSHLPRYSDYIRDGAIELGRPLDPR
jgi:hypothetical protein